jgi:hypothetical protein
LELAFQSRYGTIVNFHWFRDGFIMVAFSLGFVVVISTRAFGGVHNWFCRKIIHYVDTLLSSEKPLCHLNSS